MANSKETGWKALLHQLGSHLISIEGQPLTLQGTVSYKMLQNVGRFFFELVGAHQAEQKTASPILLASSSSHVSWTCPKGQVGGAKQYLTNTNWTLDMGKLYVCEPHQRACGLASLLSCHLNCKNKLKQVGNFKVSTWVLRHLFVLRGF